MKYAQNTNVSVESSRAEIEGLLARYGADQFMSGWDKEKAAIEFRAKNRRVRFVLPLPDRNAEEFKRSPAKKLSYGPERQYAEWEQACRQRWRALALVVKAKLEAVESGITTFEDEFMAHIVLPGGKTVGEVMHTQIEQSYKSGKFPPLLGFDEKQS